MKMNDAQSDVRNFVVYSCMSKLVGGREDRIEALGWPGVERSLVQISAIVAIREVRIFSAEEDKGFLAILFSQESVDPNRDLYWFHGWFQPCRERESG